MPRNRRKVQIEGVNGSLQRNAWKRVRFSFTLSRARKYFHPLHGSVPAQGTCVRSTLSRLPRSVLRCVGNGNACRTEFERRQHQRVLIAKVNEHVTWSNYMTVRQPSASCSVLKKPYSLLPQQRGLPILPTKGRGMGSQRLSQCSHDCYTRPRTTYSQLG